MNIHLIVSKRKAVNQPGRSPLVSPVSSAFLQSLAYGRFIGGKCSEVLVVGFLTLWLYQVPELVAV